MNSNILNYFIHKIEKYDNSLEKKLNPLISQLNIEYSTESIPIEHFINGILTLLFSDNNESTMLNLQTNFDIILYVLIKSIYLKNVIENKEKQQIIDYIIISIFDISHTDNLKEFNDVLVKIKTNVLFNNRSVITMIISYCRLYFDTFLSDELYFSNPIRACKIASGQTESWYEFLDCYHNDILNKLLAE